MCKEVFITIDEFPKYKISNRGSVFSLYSNRLLKPVLDKGNGYLLITLCDSGIRKNVFIHTLVLTYFCSERPTGYTCNHKDGDKTNNHISNLEWVTQSENVAHAYKTGLACGPSGEINGMSKLSQHDVIKIKNLIGIKKGFEIAAMFNISQSSVSMIKNGLRWRA